MARTFIVPIIPPANAQKKGTTLDPWRPKYMRELGLGFTNTTSFRYWMLLEATGSDAAMDTLASQPDVHEITPGTSIPANKRNQIANWLTKRGITDADLTLQGDALIAELRRICALAQSSETEQDRVAIFSDMTGL